MRRKKMQRNLKNLWGRLFHSEYLECNIYKERPFPPPYCLGSLDAEYKLEKMCVWCPNRKEYWNDKKIAETRKLKTVF